jgi:hypothetical protein
MFEKEAEELIEESKRLNTTPRETVRKAIEFGFQKGIKAKINTTTISDCPIKDEWHFVKSASTETLLKELKDRGVIRSWYYNGTYHVGNELSKEGE